MNYPHMIFQKEELSGEINKKKTYLEINKRIQKKIKKTQEKVLTLFEI